MKISESLYKDKNYHNVSVAFDVEPLENNQANLGFTIEEGKKVRIKTISFDGNSAYDAETLKKIWKPMKKGFSPG
ncbi:MAG: hypothetical protein R2875_15760 [Desulfobacterales bacterium]